MEKIKQDAPDEKENSFQESSPVEQTPDGEIAPEEAYIEQSEEVTIEETLEKKITRLESELEKKERALKNQEDNLPELRRKNSELEDKLNKLSQSVLTNKPVNEQDELSEQEKADLAYLDKLNRKAGYIKNTDIEEKQRISYESEVISDIQKKYGQEGFQKIQSYWNSIGSPKPTNQEGWKNLQSSLELAVFGSASLEEEKKKAADIARAEVKTNSRLSMGGNNSSAPIKNEEDNFNQLKKEYPNISENDLKNWFQDMKNMGYEV